MQFCESPDPAIPRYQSETPDARSRNQKAVSWVARPNEIGNIGAFKCDAEIDRNRFSSNLSYALPEPDINLEPLQVRPPCAVLLQHRKAGFPG
jgi:hypothetical protein